MWDTTKDAEINETGLSVDTKGRWFLDNNAFGDLTFVAFHRVLMETTECEV